jgi:hypothetical protein
LKHTKVTGSTGKLYFAIKKNNFQWEMASVMEWGDWEARRTPPAGWNEEQARAKAKLV